MSTTRVIKEKVSLTSSFHFISLGIVTVIFLILTFGYWENIFSTKVSLKSANASISALHPLGADQMGRDLLARFSMALRTTILPLWTTAVLAVIGGVILAGLSYTNEHNKIGFFSQWIISTGSSVFMAVPFGVSVFAMSVFFEGISIKGVVICGFVYILLKTFSKTMLLVNETKHLAYWNAHLSMGGSRLERFYKYGVLRDFREALSSELVFSMKLLVAAEVTLSYLGFGISEPQPSIGNILSANLDKALKGDPRILLTSVAILFIVMTVPNLIKITVHKIVDKYSN